MAHGTRRHRRAQPAARSSATGGPPIKELRVDQGTVVAAGRSKNDNKSLIDGIHGSPASFALINLGASGQT
jgi:hypothetical protein